MRGQTMAQNTELSITIPITETADMKEQGRIVVVKYQSFEERIECFWLPKPVFKSKINTIAHTLQHDHTQRNDDIIAHVS